MSITGRTLACSRSALPGQKNWRERFPSNSGNSIRSIIKERRGSEGRPQRMIPSL